MASGFRLSKVAAIVSSGRKGSAITRLMEPFVSGLSYAQSEGLPLELLSKGPGSSGKPPPPPATALPERLRNAPRTTLSKSAVPAPGGFSLDGGSQFSSLWEPNFSRMVVFDSNGKALRMLNH